MPLSIGIQHHPKRAHLLPPLLDAIGAQAEVVTDPDAANPFPSPWRTYRHALEITPAWATHRLILQDDVQLCRDFAPTVAAAVRAQPHRLLAFFVGGHPVEHAREVYAACDRDECWAEIDNLRWCPAIALCWPVELIQPCLTFVDEQRWPIKFRADDEIIGRFLRDRGELALASVPSLVQHPDNVPSLVGMRAMGGQDIGRIAACFIHPDCDPLSIDWTATPAHLA